MKKLIMIIAVAVGMTSFAAQNDPLISVEVEKGASYDVVCKGESLFSFTPSVTGKVNVQGVGTKSMNVADYQINLLAVALSGEAPSGEGTSGEGTSGAVEMEDFETPGPDAYGDSIRVLEGEFYALVWMKKDADFKGFVIDDSTIPASIVCVDKDNNQFTCVYGKADGSGKCVRAQGVTLNPPTGYEDGHFAIYVLDTRKPGANELTEAFNGLPTFLNGYKEVTSGEAVTSTGWTMMKIGETTQKFAFDPTPILEKGYAAIQSADGKWTVYEMPKAYHQEIENQTIAKEGCTILCDPATINPSFTLSDPFTLETTHQFLAFTGVVAKAVNAILPYMPKDKFGCADFKDIDAVNAAATQAVKDGKLTMAEVAEAGAFLNAVSPFWSWNCDFEVSFDRPIKAGSYVLAGYYKQAGKFGFDGWVASAFEEDLPAGKSLRLLKDNNYSGVYVSYYEICSRVQEFLCGAKNLSSDNYGTTITVKLNIYDDAKGVKATVDTYKYTFGGPLYVNCYKIGSEVAVTNICVAEHQGTSEYPLPVIKSDDDTMVFAGWSLNQDGSGELITAIPRMTHEANPVKSWYSAEEPLELYAVYKAAKPAEIIVKAATESEEEKKATLKVTEEWIDKNIGKGATPEEIKVALNGTSDGGAIPLWQTYVLGLNPSGTVEVVGTDRKDGSEDKALIVSTVQAPPPDTGFKVVYSLDKVEADESKVKKEVDSKPTQDLKIDLEPADGDTPTGYYKMNVIITPTEDGVDGASVKIPAENTIGVLKVESEEPVVPVAVPWQALDDFKSDITVDQLVKTSTLTEGDKMHVYDKDNQAYRNYELEGGEWKHIESFKIDETGAVTETKAEDPKDETVARGSGVWLERQNPEKPIYLIGQYKENQPASSEVKAPDTDSTRKVEYNLIAPTGIEDTDLNEIPSLNSDSEKINKGDIIEVVRDGAPVRYRPVANGKWGYKKQIYQKQTDGRIRVTTVDETDAKIPAGTGMWYISAGGSPTITWETAK